MRDRLVRAAPVVAGVLSWATVGAAQTAPAPAGADPPLASGSGWEDAPAQAEAPPPAGAPPVAAPAASAPGAVPPGTEAAGAPPVQGAPAVSYYPAEPPPPAPLPEYRYDPARGVPPGYRVETRIRKGLVISGAIVLGTFYGVSFLIASSSLEEPYGEPMDRWLFLPVLGPFVAAAAYPDGCRQEYDLMVCEDKGPIAAMYVLDGIAQLTGAVLLTAGLTAKSKWLVRSPQALHVGPTRLGLRGYGLGVSGRF